METIKSSSTVTEGGANTYSHLTECHKNETDKPAQKKTDHYKNLISHHEKRKEDIKEITLPKSFTDQSNESAKLSCVQHFQIHTAQWVSANKYIFSLVSTMKILGRGLPGEE